MNNKTAIITGASRGIGRAISERFARAGCNLVLNASTDSAALSEVCDYAAAAGVRCVKAPLDISGENAAEELVKICQDNFGSVDILVNNAGITRDNLLVRMSADDLDQVLNVNLRAAILLMKAVTRPMMKQRSGRIINISSVVGSTGNAGQVNYSASKAGLIAASKSLAKEIGSRGVTVNAIAPGFIESDMTDQLPEDVKKTMMGQIALARFGSPEDVAGVAEFLAGAASAYITGQVINICGGMVM